MPGRIRASGGGDPVKAIQIAFKARRELYGKGFEKGLKRAGALLLTKSQEIVPIDTGALTSTGKNVFRTHHGRPEARVSYGPVFDPGTGQEYSLDVHEDLRVAHGEEFNLKHADEIAAGLTHARRPEEQAKYLERPARQNAKAMGDIVEAEMKKEIR